MAGLLERLRTEASEQGYSLSLIQVVPTISIQLKSGTTVTLSFPFKESMSENDYSKLFWREIQSREKAEAPKPAPEAEASATPEDLVGKAKKNLWPQELIDEASASSDERYQAALKFMSTTDRKSAFPLVPEDDIDMESLLAKLG